MHTNPQANSWLHSSTPKSKPIFVGEDGHPSALYSVSTWFFTIQTMSNWDDLCFVGKLREWTLGLCNKILVRLHFDSLKWQKHQLMQCWFLLTNLLNLGRVAILPNKAQRNEPKFLWFPKISIFVPCGKFGIDFNHLEKSPKYVECASNFSFGAI